MLSAQTATLHKNIGYLDSQNALFFEGNTAYPKEQICKALYRDKDVIIAASHTAPLDNYLEVLQSKIRLGYLKGGFASPKVDVSYVAQPEHILIRIEEGPRYTKGNLVIEGASETLKNDLTRWLNEIGSRTEDNSNDLDLFDKMRQSMPQQPPMVLRPLQPGDFGEP